MRSKEEIAEEITALKAIEDSIVPTSMFGDDNLEQHAAALDVLENDLDDNDIEEKYDMDEEYEVYSAARGAREWMDGDTDDKPSEDFPLQQ